MLPSKLLLFLQLTLEQTINKHFCLPVMIDHSKMIIIHHLKLEENGIETTLKSSFELRKQKSILRRKLSSNGAVGSVLVRGKFIALLFGLSINAFRAAWTTLSNPIRRQIRGGNLNAKEPLSHVYTYLTTLDKNQSFNGAILLDKSLKWRVIFQNES